ncbi:MAG TPA: hypothetical protein VFZ65_07940 [Planctomycetota bacterium]|nr:hypothetical protein [Planctomycetota bacterium]
MSWLRGTSVVGSVLATVLGGAAYGFCIGCSKNLLYGARSAIKVPMLLLGTACLCALAYHMFARLCGVGLPFAAVQRASLLVFRTVAVLLASLAPVSLFLGRTMVRPEGLSLGGYPGFVGVNMCFLAAAGSVALLLQARLLFAEHAVPAPRARFVVGCWLALSLLVGGQLAFYLRPFFGIASLTGEPPLWLGAEPTATGARNFYEIVWQFVVGTGLPGPAGGR